METKRKQSGNTNGNKAETKWKHEWKRNGSNVLDVEAIVMEFCCLPVGVGISASGNVDSPIAARQEGPP